MKDRYSDRKHDWSVIAKVVGTIATLLAIITSAYRMGMTAGRNEERLSQSEKIFQLQKDLIEEKEKNVRRLYEIQYGQESG